MATLIWRSASRHPKRQIMVFRASMEYIATVVCRKEIEEARRRIVISNRRYFYQPSEEYQKAKISYFKPKFKRYANTYSGTIRSTEEWKRHLHDFSLQR